MKTPVLTANTRAHTQQGRRGTWGLGLASLLILSLGACTLPRPRATATAPAQIQVTIMATPATPATAADATEAPAANATAVISPTAGAPISETNSTDAPSASTTSTPVAASTGPATGPVNVRLEKLVDGLDEPVYLTQAGNGTAVLYIVEQAGRVLTYDTGKLSETPFLDIVDRVNSSGNEQGLLSIVFSPNYASDRFFYVNYTAKNGDSVTSRFRANDDGQTADADSELVLLTIEDPYANHNGGLLKFGPDGMLYLGMGDGGSAGDPQNHAQDTQSLLGKMLRIDVSKASEAQPYAIPADNPNFGTDARPELWAVGLRNPWRFSFDRETGDLYIADVGQNAYEEVNFQSAGAGGLNYGWKLREGFEEYSGDKQPQFTEPVAEYPHAEGCSVTGGYVYRGKAIPGLVGTYLYGDYCQGTIWRLTRDGETWNPEELLKDNLRISSFGEDDAGELYVLDHSGAVYKIVAE